MAIVPGRNLLERVTDATSHGLAQRTAGELHAER